jgi:hypothetical protein
MAKSVNFFVADDFMQKWSPEDHIPGHENEFDFRNCIIKAFNLPENDEYTYRAQGVTTLSITQKAINGKRAHGLHGWYHDESGKPVEPQHPSPDEIDAYVSLFTPSVALPKALNSFKGSAKANSLRDQVAKHLDSRFLNKTSGLLPNKKDRQHTNPYLDLWGYSCRELEWAGPIPATSHTKIAHHILPVFYHHLGCIVPSYAALHVIAKLAQPSKPSKEPVRPILDVGSGNGYWTHMLRSFPLPDPAMKKLEVVAIDNQLSEYRITWIDDTIITDGISYLKTPPSNPNTAAIQQGGKNCILLLVYPQATGDFTPSVMKAFQGDTIVVAGTQNKNGFTAFQDQVVDEWVEKNLKDFELTLRAPLPSFAGKDEALFVFQRKS